MDINYRKFLIELGILPLDRKHRFTLTHFGNQADAMADNLIHDLQHRIGPQVGGVYLYKVGRRCLYVGKSINIAQRVGTHNQRAFQPDPHSDRYGVHHAFWEANVGRLTVNWISLEQEIDRQIVEMMLTKELRPIFEFPI